MANASSDPAVETKGANALTEVTGAGEMEFQTKGKFSLVDELLRMVSAEPAVEETFDRSTLNVALLVVTFSSKCTTWATPCVGVSTQGTAAIGNDHRIGRPEIHDARPVLVLALQDGRPRSRRWIRWRPNQMRKLR